MENPSWLTIRKTLSGERLFSAFFQNGITLVRFLFELMPDKRLFLFWNYSLKPIRIFTKTLTMHDIMEYDKSENFKYLAIKASHGDYYGFNIKVKKNEPMP
jgi:hypothetical protein